MFIFAISKWRAPCGLASTITAALMASVAPVWGAPGDRSIEEITADLLQSVGGDFDFVVRCNVAAGFFEGVLFNINTGDDAFVEESSTPCDVVNGQAAGSRIDAALAQILPGLNANADLIPALGIVRAAARGQRGAALIPNPPPIAPRRLGEPPANANAEPRVVLGSRSIEASAGFDEVDEADEADPVLDLADRLIAEIDEPGFSISEEDRARAVFLELPGAPSKDDCLDRVQQVLDLILPVRARLIRAEAGIERVREFLENVSPPDQQLTQEELVDENLELIELLVELRLQDLIEVPPEFQRFLDRVEDISNFNRLSFDDIADETRQIDELNAAIPRVVQQEEEARRERLADAQRLLADGQARLAEEQRIAAAAERALRERFGDLNFPGAPTSKRDLLAALGKLIDRNPRFEQTPLFPDINPETAGEDIADSLLTSNNLLGPQESFFEVFSEDNFVIFTDQGERFDSVSELAALDPAIAEFVALATAVDQSQRNIFDLRGDLIDLEFEVRRREIELSVPIASDLIDRASTAQDGLNLIDEFFDGPSAVLARDGLLPGRGLIEKLEAVRDSDRELLDSLLLRLARERRRCPDQDRDARLFPAAAGEQTIVSSFTLAPRGPDGLAFASTLSGEALVGDPRLTVFTSASVTGNQDDRRQIGQDGETISGSIGASWRFNDALTAGVVGRYGHSDLSGAGGSTVVDAVSLGAFSNFTLENGVSLSAVGAYTHGEIDASFIQGGATATGETDVDSVALQVGASRAFEASGVSITPSVNLGYVNTNRSGFNLSDGAVTPASQSDQFTASGAVSLSRRFEIGQGGATLTPSLTLSGVANLTEGEALVLADGSPAESGRFGGGVNLGLSYQSPAGVSGGLSLGASGFESGQFGYSLAAQVSIPLY